MKTNNFSFSDFSLNISEPYEDRGVEYQNYDFTSKLGDRYAYFSVCIDKEKPEYGSIPECYDFSDYDTKEAIEELFRLKSNEEIVNFFSEYLN